ncbi:MAG TPA: Na+/H+ antiporter NhaC family protein [Tissierellaceae bacterium]
MSNKDSKKSIKGLLPLVFFLVIYVATGVLSGEFDSMPLLLGFMFTTGFALLFDRPGEKTSLDDKLEVFASRAGESTIIIMVLIFMLAGAFYSIAEEMGAVSSIVNLGLTVLPANALLPGLFIIGAILSFSMGTSMGTITALAPIGVGIAEQTGMDLALVMGTVVGSAMFGDNLSFISDTTIAAIRTQGVGPRDKFKANGLIVLPAVILTIIILFFKSTGELDAGGSYPYELVRIIPYIVIILTALIGWNVMTVLGSGIAVGSLVGFLMGDFGYVEWLQVLQRGMGWMQDLAMIAIVVGGVVGLMDYYGGIDYLLDFAQKKIKSKKGAEFGMAILVSLIDVATTNNTIAIITAGPLAKQFGEEYDIDPRRTAGLLDIFSSAFQGIIPYGGQLLVAAGIAGISPVAIVPHATYSFLMIVFGVLAILTGRPKFKSDLQETK